MPVVVNTYKNISINIHMKTGSLYKKADINKNKNCIQCNYKLNGLNDLKGI